MRRALPCPVPESLSEKNAVESPLYTYLDAARYLAFHLGLLYRFPLPCRTTPGCSLIESGTIRSSCACITDDYGPIAPEQKDHRISFRSLVSLFVCSAVFRPPLACIPFYRRHPKDVFRLFRAKP